jgi:hypothetical protein
MILAFQPGGGLERWKIDIHFRHNNGANLQCYCYKIIQRYDTEPMR